MKKHALLLSYLASFLLLFSNLSTAQTTLYLTGRTDTIRTSTDGGENWSTFATVPSGQFRGISAGNSFGETFVFANDMNGGTGETDRPLIAYDSSGNELDSRPFNSEGGFNSHPVLYFGGYVFVNTGDNDASPGVNTGLETKSFSWSDLSLGASSPADVPGFWQARDLALAPSGSTNYIFFNGAFPGLNAQRGTIDGDGTNSSQTAITITSTLTDYTDFAGTESGRLLVIGPEGIFISAQNQLDLTAITLSSAVAFTGTENSATGDMGPNGRDMILLDGVLYAVSNTNVYRYNLNDAAGTLTFDSAYPHGFNDSDVQIAGVVAPTVLAERLYLTSFSDTIRASLDGGETWEPFPNIPGAGLRGIAAGRLDGETTVFANDNNTAADSTPIYAFTENGIQFTSTTYDRTGAFNQQPLAYKDGFVYVSSGRDSDGPGPENGPQMFSSSWDGFDLGLPTDAEIGAWQGNDITFAEDGGTDYIFLNGAGGTTIRRAELDGDGTVSSIAGINTSGATFIQDLAFTDSGRLLVLDSTGWFISATGQVATAGPIALSSVLAFTGTEDSGTGDMGPNARDFVLLNDTIYAVTDTHVYRYALDDSLGTVTFLSANVHGANSSGVQIAGLLVVTAPPNISIGPNGSGLQIIFDGGNLQENSDLTNGAGWSDVVDATSPYDIPSPSGENFFRVNQP